MNTLIRRLDQIDGTHTLEAGGKGSSLGELLRAGAPVPPAFVVTSAAFSAFMKEADPEDVVEQIFKDLDSSSIHAAEAADEIASVLRDAPIPKQVDAAIRAAVAELGSPLLSVRSSATCEDSSEAAWAGQLDTFLAVAPEDVLEKVRLCWLSIFSPQALSYGAARGFGTGSMAVAVVVQEMINSDVSGIGFSVHPVTQEPGVMLIEACLGLGEAIVSGRIAPDQYVVEKGTGQVAQRTIGRQREGLFVEPKTTTTVWRNLGSHGTEPKLTDAQVLEYAELLAQIERHYGYPVDTEWALEAGTFKLLQARPITTLAREYREPVVDPETEWELIIRRPMSLMEISVWSHWVDSKHTDGALGISADRVLAIQDDADIASIFFAAHVGEGALEHLAALYRQDRAQLIALLRQGRDVYRNVRARFDSGPRPSLDEACELFIDALQYAGAIPFFVLSGGESTGADDPEIRGLAEELRAQTLYPFVVRRLIDPVVSNLAREFGFSAPDQAAKLATWSELHRGELNRDTLESRWEAVRRGERYVFQCLPGGEHVRFVSETGYLLMRAAHRRDIAAPENADEIRGQAAWPGVHRGRARVILTPDAEGQTLEDGEVLVSIQSSPALMPLLLRCGAIVTDDGGVACHAAIICRELKKPTIIGTETATSTIRTGDLIEVDAYAQVVRILERAGTAAQ